MLSKSTEIFAKSLGLSVGEDCASGVYNGYYLSVYEQKGKKVLKITCHIGSIDEYAEDHLNLKDLFYNVLTKQSIYSISDYAVHDSGIDVVTRAPIVLLRELTNHIIDTLRENDIPDSQFCTDCGAEFSSDAKRWVVSVVAGDKTKQKRLLCENCALSTAEAAEKSPDMAGEKSKPHYMKGLFVSLAAGLASSLVYTFLFFILGINGRGDMTRYFVCLAGILTGGAVFAAYKRAAKGMDATGLAITISMTTILLALSHFFGCVLGLATYLKNQFGISLTTFAHKSLPYFKMQFSDATSLRFLVVGFIISLCAAFVAFILFYGTDFKKDAARNRQRVTIQTIK